MSSDQSNNLSSASETPVEPAAGPPPKKKFVYPTANPNLLDGVEVPWEMLPGETPKAFRAFTIYRDMGADRSVCAAANKLYEAENGHPRNPPYINKTLPRNFNEWSRLWAWVKRATAYDGYMDRVKLAKERAEREKQIEQMHKRHADIAYLMLARVAARLNGMTEEDIAAITMTQAVQMFAAGSKIERAARGEPTEIVEERSGSQPDLGDHFVRAIKGASRERLEQLEAAVAGLLGGPDGDGAEGEPVTGGEA